MKNRIFKSNNRKADGKLFDEKKENRIGYRIDR